MHAGMIIASPPKVTSILSGCAGGLRAIYADRPPLAMSSDRPAHHEDEVARGQLHAAVDLEREIDDPIAVQVRQTDHRAVGLSLS